MARRTLLTWASVAGRKGIMSPHEANVIVVIEVRLDDALLSARIDLEVVLIHLVVCVAIAKTYPVRLTVFAVDRRVAPGDVDVESGIVCRVTLVLALIRERVLKSHRLGCHRVRPAG